MVSSRMLALAIAVAAVPLCSCVERKEHLVITPGGSVMHQVTHKSDSAEDLYGGDAVPRVQGGWTAREQVEKDEDGKATHTLIAESVFPAGAPLPANFALPTDADADLYLQFPTTVKIERRREGVYYHFARVYAPRPWAVIERLRERLVEAPMADLKDVEPKDWTPAERETVVRALTAFEMEKTVLFARAAFRKATPDLPQDGWLGVERQLRDCLHHFDYARFAKLLVETAEGPDDDLREKAVHAELQGLAEELVDQLKAALFTHANYDGSQFNRFMVEFDRQRKYHDVTEDLADDRFEITVEMPGQIIASNAESVRGSTAKWSFDGQTMRDREFELMATSRVTR